MSGELKLTFVITPMLNLWPWKTIVLCNTAVRDWSKGAPAIEKWFLRVNFQSSLPEKVEYEPNPKSLCRLMTSPVVVS